MIERIKEFLKEKGLNWTGKIITYLDNDFRVAEEKDFKDKDLYFLLLSFKNGTSCITIEIDLVTFYILGEFRDVGIEKYLNISDKDRKILEELQSKDLSKEWINFQLKHSPLIYKNALKHYCEKHKQEIEEKYKQREKKLLLELNNLENYKEKSLKEYKEIEALIENNKKEL